MPLTSDIGSHSFNLGLEVFRARIAANGRGDITVGGETVSIVYDATDGSFSSSGGNGGLLSDLLILGFNNGPRALSERFCLSRETSVPARVCSMSHYIGDTRGRGVY